MTPTDELIETLRKHLEHSDYIKSEEIPDIELYMDQVTTFMNTHLNDSKRYPDDKILTKTMINNYTKNKLLPPPEKKKYSKNHLLILIFIYYLKGFLSIGDIQKLLAPLTEQHYDKDSSLTLEEIYDTIFAFEQKELHKLKNELTEKNELAKTVFNHTEDSEFLQTFTLICLLSFDVYINKKMIETMLDELIPDTTDGKAEKKAEKKAKKE